MDYRDFPFCPAEAGEALDNLYASANPERKFWIREALTDEIDAFRAETGRGCRLNPGEIGFIISRRYSESILRDTFAVPADSRNEMLEEGKSEDSCRSGYFQLAKMRAIERVLRRLDWDRIGETLQ